MMSLNCLCRQEFHDLRYGDSAVASASFAEGKKVISFDCCVESVQKQEQVKAKSKGRG